MALQKLSSTDAFVVVDLDGAQDADGIVRCARKVLADSTRALARSRSYSWALLDKRTSGASVGVNAEGDTRAAALTAAAGELAPRVADGSLHLAAGKGVAASELAALGTVVEPDPDALAAGLVAAATVAAGGIEGRRVAIEHDGGAGPALGEALVAAGAEILDTGSDALAAEADVLFYGSKAGLLDHHRVAELPQSILVPTAEMCLTPRGLAVAGRRGIAVVADFLALAGPLARRAGLDPADTVAALAAEVAGHEDGPVIGACRRAEDFLSTWVDELPFGRPIG